LRSLPSRFCGLGHGRGRDGVQGWRKERGVEAVRQCGLCPCARAGTVATRAMALWTTVAWREAGWGRGCADAAIVRWNSRRGLGWRSSLVLFRVADGVVVGWLDAVTKRW